MHLLSRQTKRKDIWNIACPQQICCWWRRKRPFIWRLQRHFVQDKSWLSGAHSPLLFVYHPAHANQFPRTGIIKWNTAVFTSVSSFCPLMLRANPTLHNRMRWGVSSCQTFVCELQMHHSVSHILWQDASVLLRSREWHLLQEFDPSKLSQGSTPNEEESLRSQHDFHARYVRMRDGLAS